MSFGFYNGGKRLRMAPDDGEMMTLKDRDVLPVTVPKSSGVLLAALGLLLILDKSQRTPVLVCVGNAFCHHG
jgi:hypothetical protein